MSEARRRRLPPPWSYPWFWEAQAIGWLLYVTGAFLSDLAAVDAGEEPILGSVPVRLVRVSLGLVVSSVLALGLQRLPDLRTAPRSFAAFTLLGAAVAGSVWYPLYRILSHPWRPVGDEILQFDCLLPCLMEHIWLMFTWSVLYLAVTELRRAAAREQDRLRAERMASEARYQMLVYQVNPHFLFNALNSVRALATEDVARAREMITRLAAFLRHTLMSRPFAAVPLQRELEIITMYLAIEQVRHEEALQVRFDIASDVREVRLPGFLLHPLVENAITHGFPAPGTILRIAVRARREAGRLVIEVVNSGTLRTDGAEGTGIGLRNVGERLAHLYGDGASVTVEEAQGDVVARIGIPLDSLEASA